MKKLTVTQIDCVNVSKNAVLDIGDDDVYAMFQADGGAPLPYPATGHIEMGSGKNYALDPHLVIYFNYGCYISLWDKDGVVNEINQSDLLGNMGFLPSDTSRVYDLDTNNDAHYKLHVTIEDATFGGAA